MHVRVHVCDSNTFYSFDQDLKCLFYLSNFDNKFQKQQSSHEKKFGNAHQSMPSADPEGGTGGPDPLENHKIYSFYRE